MDEFREAFALYDRDHGGHITAKDLAAVLHSSGQNFSEFLAMMRRKYKQMEDTQESVKEAVKMFFKDGDGFITTDELKYVMTILGEKLTELGADEVLREA